MVDFESAVRCLTSPIFNSLFIDFSPKQIQLSPHRTHLYLAFGEKKLCYTVLNGISWAKKSIVRDGKMKCSATNTSFKDDHKPSHLSPPFKWSATGKMS
jgi:hypothetical protein